MHTLWLSPALLAMLAGPLSDAADEQAIAPNLTDAQTEVLAIREDRHNRYTVPVTIDGVGPFHFMIDTGSQGTAITDAVHAQLSLAPAGTATVIGTASRKQVNLVEVESLGLGFRTIYDIEALVLIKDHVGADGIIGLDTLQDLRVLIDFRDESIAIADTHEKVSRRGYEIVVRAREKLGQLLISNAVVEGVKATLIIDTGAQGSIGNMALRERVRQRREHEILTTDVNGVSMIGNFTFARSVTIQNMELSNIPITYADTPAFEALGLTDEPVLMLGMRQLRLFDRIAIDFSRRRVLFDLPKQNRSRGRY